MTVSPTIPLFQPGFFGMSGPFRRRQTVPGLFHAFDAFFQRAAQRGGNPELCQSNPAHSRKPGTNRDGKAFAAFRRAEIGTITMVISRANLTMRSKSQGGAFRRGGEDWHTCVSAPVGIVMVLTYQPPQELQLPPPQPAQPPPPPAIGAGNPGFVTGTTAETG